MAVQVRIYEFIDFFGGVFGKRISTVAIKNTETFSVNQGQFFMCKSVLDGIVGLELKRINGVKLNTRLRRVRLLGTETRLNFFFLNLRELMWS